MATRSEISKINLIVETIQKNSPISKVQLVMKTSLSISYFDKLKPFVEEIYATKVRWDKNTKLWYYIKFTEIEPELSNKLQDTMPTNEP